MSNLKESEAMLEVRAWKAECDAEVAHLPDREAVRKRLTDSARVAERLGIRYAPSALEHSSAVAEPPAEYRNARQTKNNGGD